MILATYKRCIGKTTCAEASAIAALLVLLWSVSFAQDTLKIMTYNLLNYISTDASRDGYYKTVINAAKPDVLVVQEITSQEAVNNFLTNVVNASGAGNYSASEFRDGPDTDNAIYLKSGTISFLSNTSIRTALRDITEFKLLHVASAETLRIYSVHLKASSGTNNEVLRAAEVDSLRKVTDALGFGKNFVVVGDFNIYGSNEPAYQKLLQVRQGADGHFIDAITMSGMWNNPAYAMYHTQSPRTRSFGGGSTGGLDDRFDLILYSKAVNDAGGITYVPGSMTAFGNDGKHYNDSINKMPNDAVSTDVANALHYASDHLPVTALFEFKGIINGVNNEKNVIADRFQLHQNYPNPFNPRTSFEFQVPSSYAKGASASGGEFVSIKVFDMLGREVAQLVNGIRSPGMYKVTWDASALPSGVYLYRMQAGSFVETRKAVLMK